MADYYLKTADGSKMYRLNYTAAGDPLVINLNDVHVTGIGVRLPDGNVVTGDDLGIDMQPVLVDLILGNVVAATLAEYRTLVKAVIDTKWT